MSHDRKNKSENLVRWYLSCSIRLSCFTIKHLGEGDKKKLIKMKSNKQADVIGHGALEECHTTANTCQKISLGGTYHGQSVMLLYYQTCLFHI